VLRTKKIVSASQAPGGNELVGRKRRGLAVWMAENLEQELLDLGLLDYCRAALERVGRA
jgi:hypothetical protein